MENKKESYSSSFLGTNKDLPIREVRVQTCTHKDGEPQMKDYIILKLRSGEEIIASLKSKNRNGMKIFRPMQIKQIPFVDPRTGTMRAAVVMENWIGRTNDNEVVVPNNWVGVKLVPSVEMVDTYERHMNIEDSLVNQKIAIEQPKSETEPAKPNPMVEVESELKKLEDEMSKAFLDMLVSGSMEKKLEDAPSIPNDGKDVVIVNFMFPTKVFKNMMEEGLLDELFTMGSELQDIDDADDLEDDVDFVQTPKKKINEEADSSNLGESGKETFGNSFKDWSPDPRDYL